jgi:hypothetical protein
MKRSKQTKAITALWLILGIVVLTQSFIFLFRVDATRAIAVPGLPDALRLIIGWGEITAAVLFLLPRTLIFGAWSLLTVFCWAVMIHLAHGEFNVGSLFVYSAAVVVVMAHRPRGTNTDAAIS